MRKNNRMSVFASFALSLVLLCGLFTLAAGAVGGVLAGDGSAETPYEIADAADLAAFRDLVNATPSSTANAVLVADIDLENQNWKRIFPDSGYAFIKRILNLNFFCIGVIKRKYQNKACE